MILRILDAKVVGPYSLNLQFDDGTSGTADLLPMLTGPVFEPLKDPSYFAQVRVDPICQTVVWPNGADMAPEALRELVAQEQSSTN